MLSKNFKSNKFYEVTRYIFKYGRETDEIDASTTVWDSFEKAIAYIERYATGLKFAFASVEEIVVDREITADDYKHNNFKYFSSQKIYDVTLDWNEDFAKEEVVYFEKEEKTEEHFKVQDCTEQKEIPYVYEETEEKVTSIYENLASKNNHVYKIYKHVNGKWEFLKAINYNHSYKIAKIGKPYLTNISSKFYTLDEATKEADILSKINGVQYEVYLCNLDKYGYEICTLI